MGTVNDNDIFSPNQYEGIYYEAAIVAKRAPTARDKNYEISKVWVDSTLDDVYVLTSVKAGVPSWINCGGGTGTFAALNVAGAATIGGVLTLSASTAGTLRTDATGIVSALADGTNGQIPIGSTGLAPAWASITSASLVITPGAGTLNIEESGGIANSYTTTAGGPIAPLLGVVNVLGFDANITTDGNTANTILVRLADTITAVAGIVATNDLTMSAGTCTITSDDNSTNAIYLHADAGAGEQIHIRANQGTAANSVILSSDVGGLLVSGGLASADAINIQATDAAGGIDVDFGTGGLSMVGANGAINLESGTSAINVGVDAVAKTVTVGSTTGAAATVIQSGTGNTVLTSTDDILIDSAGVLEINSSAGIISIANDAVAQNVNIATGAAQRILTLGNTSGTSSVIADCGTGGVSIGASANAHASVFGSTNTTSSTTIQSGTGDLILTSTDDMTLDSAGVLELNSTAGIIGIASDADAFDVNISTGASERITTIGNITTASSVVLNVGTGNCDLGVSATSHLTRVGSTSGTSALTAQTGTGALTVTAGGILDINATGDTTLDVSAGILDVSTSGNITLDSSAGTIAIGADDIDQNISIGLNGERVTTIGNQVGVCGLVLASGTGGTQLNSLGLLSTEAITDTQAGAATTVSANIGQSIHTGLTTAAAATQVLTITNTLCTVNSVILATASNFGANDAQIHITRVIPAAGSFTVTVLNSGAAALNGNISIAFWLLQV